MYRSPIHFASGLLVVGVLLTTIGCDYNPPSAPDSSVSGPEGGVISIGSSGLTPGAVTITSGQSVTFVNTDSVAHEIVSTPVPTYDDCPAINRVRRLEPGQRMQTGALTITRSCGFIDLLRAGDPRWQGSITVQ